MRIPIKVTTALESQADLNAVLAMMTSLNERIIVARGLPRLYSTSIRYQREPRGQEVFQLADEVHRTGRGDCEDLASLRAAELRLQGEDAHAVCEQHGGTLHCIVVRESGVVEDPSARLGMYGEVGAVLGRSQNLPAWRAKIRSVFAKAKPVVEQAMRAAQTRAPQARAVRTVTEAVERARRAVERADASTAAPVDEVEVEVDEEPVEEVEES